MFDAFAAIGMILVILTAVLVFTYLAGVVSGDDDCCFRWIVTCVLYAVTVTLFIMYINHGA